MKKALICLFLALAALVLLTACSGKAGSTETETPADTQPVTDPGTTPAVPETSDVTVPETGPQTEPVTEDPNAIPTVDAAVIGTANVAPQGYVIGSSTLQDSFHSNLYLNDGSTRTGFSSKDFASATAEAHLFIDLGCSWTLRQVVLYPSEREADAGFFPAAFDVEVSADGRDYTSVGSFTGVSGVGAEGFAVELSGVKAQFVRIAVTEMNGSGAKYRYALGEMEVYADVDRTTNLLLNQNDVWLYMDTHETLRTVSHRISNAEDDAPLRFMSADESVAVVDHATGLITPTGYGDTLVYAFDGENLTACKVRVIDDSRTGFRISTFYLSAYMDPDYIPQSLDYMVEAGIGFLEECNAYDHAGNEICDYMMYECAKRGIFYSVCDVINTDMLIKARESKLDELIQKYENRAGFGGIHLADEPHEESNDYARVADYIRNYNYHITPHLNLLPIGGFPSWEEYVSEYCAITGGTHRMEYLSYDNYPFLYNGMFDNNVYNSLNKIRNYGLKYNASTGYYLQVMEIINSYRVMSDIDLKYNATLGFAYGMKNYKWFVFQTPINSGESFTTGLLGPDYTPSVMFDGVAAVNKLIKEYGTILGDHDAAEVYHNKAGYGNEAVPSTFPVTQISKNDAIFTLYCPISGNGCQYVVISNKNISTFGDREFSLRLADDLDSIELYEDGEFVEVILNDKDFGVIIPAGSCIILRLPADYDGRQPVTAHENLALDGAVFVSSSTYTFWTESDTASFHLNDGNTSSGGWIGANKDAGTYLLVDLKEVSKVSRVELFPYVGQKTAKFPAEFTILVSTDGQTWTEVYKTAEASTDGKSAWTCAFDAVNARYVRIDLTKKALALGEIEIYAD